MIRLNCKRIARAFAFWRVLKGQSLSLPSFRPWQMEPGKTILSLSPHSDDDVIGWGGWLHRNALQGNTIISVCLTDGSGGGGALYTDRETLIRLRKEEFRRAAQLIGTTEVLFWDEPDGQLRPNRDLVKRLGSLINTVCPDIVVLPSFLDAHSDHQATGELLARTLSHKTDRDIMCLQGEIWTPLPYCNAHVVIDPVLEIKERAILTFKTQVCQADFLGAALGLARYRAVFAQVEGRYIECFLATRCDEYVKTWKLLKR
jgi:LmbE family N-acetylglucosaminyl deacetylase